MKRQDQSLLRQFLIYFIIPVVVLIVGSIVAVNLLNSDSETITVDAVNVSATGILSTKEFSYLLGEDSTSIATNPPDSEFAGSTETNPETTPTPEQNKPKIISTKNEMLFYGGLVVCGGIIILIIGAGVFLFVLPQNKNS